MVSQREQVGLVLGVVVVEVFGIGEAARDGFDIAQRILERLTPATADIVIGTGQLFLEAQRPFAQALTTFGQREHVIRQQRLEAHLAGGQTLLIARAPGEEDFTGLTRGRLLDPQRGADARQPILGTDVIQRQCGHQLTIEEGGIVEAAVSQEVVCDEREVEGIVDDRHDAAPLSQ